MTNTPTMRDYISIINERITGSAFDQYGNQVDDPFSYPSTQQNPKPQAPPTARPPYASAPPGLPNPTSPKISNLSKFGKIGGGAGMLLWPSELGDDDEAPKDKTLAPEIQQQMNVQQPAPVAPPIAKPTGSTVKHAKRTGSAKCTYKPDVAKWQELLNANGAKLKVDGCYGPKTQAAYDSIFGKDNKPRQDFEKQSSAYQSSTDYTPTPYSDDKPYNYVDQERAAQQAAADARRANTNMYEHDLQNKVSGLREYISTLSEDRTQDFQRQWAQGQATRPIAPQNMQPQYSHPAAPAQTPPELDTDDESGVYDQHQLRQGTQQDLQNLYRGFRSEPQSQSPVSRVPSSPTPATQYNSASNPPPSYDTENDDLLTLPKAAPEQLKWLQQYQQRTQSQNGIFGGKGPLRVAEDLSSMDSDRNNVVMVPGIGPLAPAEFAKLKQCYDAAVKPASSRAVMTPAPSSTTGSIAKTPATSSSKSTAGNIGAASNTANFSKSNASAGISRMGVNESTELSRLIQLATHQK
jgi:hypothetical protein